MKRRGAQVVFLLVIMILGASVSSAEPVPVVASFQGATLADVLKFVQEKAGVQIEFAKKLVDSAAPVTAEAHGLLLDEFLYRVLRPSGIEFVWTGANAVKLIPAASGAGMLKQAGRALRTLARLETKIEKAEQQGDEVRIPGWSDADDHELMEALSDIAGAIAYAQMLRPSVGENLLSAEDGGEMLVGVDRDLRIGAALGVVSNWFGSYYEYSSDVKPLVDGLVAMARDPDPCVRAAGVFALMRRPGGAANPRYDECMRLCKSATNDPAWEVRFVAALAGRQADVVPSALYASLTKDECMAVRLAAMLRGGESGGLAAESGGQGRFGRLIRDRNPIARPFGLRFAGFDFRGEKAAELAKVVAAAGDPWLNVCARVVVPRIGRNPQESIRAAAEMVASAKPSHQVVGALGCTTYALERERLPDAAAVMAPLRNVAEPHRLWVRLPVVIFSRVMGDDKGDARLAAALRSDDESVRIAALIGCNLPKRGAALGELREGVLASFRRPVFAEKLAAALTLCQSDTWEECLALFREEMQRDPQSLSAKVLLMLLPRNPGIIDVAPHEKVVERAMGVLELVLPARHPELEMLFIRGFRWPLGLKVNERYPVLERLIRDGQPETVCGILRAGGMGIYREWAHGSREVAALMLARLEAMFDSRERRTRSCAVKGLVPELRNPEWGRLAGDEPGKAKVVRLLVKGLGDSFKGHDAATEDGFSLLKVVVRPSAEPFLPWKDAPTELRQAAVQALGYVNHKTQGRHATEFLRDLFLCEGAHGEGWDITKHDPPLKEAMEAARRAVMAAGTVENQIVLLLSLVQSREQAERSAASGELERRMIEGQVPRGMQISVLGTMGSAPDLLSPRFAEHLVTHLAGEAETFGVRPAMMTLLRAAAEVRLQEHRRQGLPLPAWIERAAEVSWTIASDPVRSDFEQQEAVRLYMRAAGQKAEAKIGAMIRGDDQPIYLRQRVAGLLPEAFPETNLYAEILKEYERIPGVVRETLAGAAARSPKAGGSEGFVLAFLKDREAGIHRHRVLGDLRLPETPALRAALEELRKEPEFGNAAADVLARFDREAGRDVGPAPAPQRSAQDYERELATLKDAAWKKEDPIQKHLTWYGLNPGLAIADAQARSVTRVRGLLGGDATVVNGIAFEEKRVWVGTDRGLVAWHRAGRVWTLFAVGGKFADAPVEKLELQDGVLRVTIHPEGQKAAIWEYDAKTGKWREVPP